MTFAQLAASFLANVKGHEAHKELEALLRHTYLSGMSDALLLTGDGHRLMPQAVVVASTEVITTNKKLSEQ